MDLSLRLKEERKRLGLTQAEFAQIVGIATNTQNNYERGERFPTADYMAAASAAGVDVLYVITGHRTPSKEEGLTPKEKAVLDNYRSLGEGDQAAVQRLTDALAQSTPVGKSSGSGTKH